MRLKIILAFILLTFIPDSALPTTEIRDSIAVTTSKYLIETTLNEDEKDSLLNSSEDSVPEIIIPEKKSDSFVKNEKKEYVPIDVQQILAKVEQNLPKTKRVVINDRFLQTNPLFIDLLFHGYSAKPVQLEKWDEKDFVFNKTASQLKIRNFTALYGVENSLQNLREKIIRQFVVSNPHFIAYKIDNLPDVSDFIKFELNTKPIEETVLLNRKRFDYEHRKLNIEKIKRNPWTTKSNALLQFSQNYISKNWYQGGSDNISILGILNGTFNYDDKKNIQWDNFAEWRLGFNSVEGDTIRTLNTNDDILRATSKLGIKAGGNWFYSGSVDFSTQFFNSYKAVNSQVMKAKLFTPVRLNINVGLDYKYKKLFSLMFSPLSYKFIYASDTLLVDQKSFGIPKGQNILSQVGSSFKAQLSYSPTRNIQIDSKLNFYTNYEKIEVDWEIISNFKFNRFLSTRLSLNPRYDNTVLTDERARIQFKQLLTFGLSYKLL
ncbi:MAG: DUF3078 domain-containing protein [Paludibacter sp.]|nr:DUF3078 domain-containing protein [Paludibacter sp.]